MTRSTWSELDVPDLGGTRAIVTGASSGIGLEASRILAGAGAEVVLAVRDPERGRRAAEEISRTVPGARLEVSEIDLVLLHTEKRDLMSVEPAEWTITGEPFDWHIDPWTPEQAEREFLRAAPETPPAPLHTGAADAGRNADTTRRNTRATYL